MTIRRLAPDDLGVLNQRLPTWNRLEYARRLAAQQRGEMLQVIAWIAGEPAGRGMVLFPGHAEHSPSAERERCAEVRDVFVPEPHRRKGVASALMNALEEAARRNGHERVGLSVGLDDQAAPPRALYDALGYTRAHGPFISSTTLEGDDGPIPVGAVLVYLTKPL